MADEQREQAELIEIDITNMSLQDSDEYGVDANADFWLASAPPPDGLFKVKIYGGKKPFKQGETESRDKFIRAELDLKIIDEGDWKDTRIFANVSTYVSDNKDTCSMVSLLNKLGIKTGDTVTMLKLARLLGTVLPKEPIAYIEGQWKAWSQAEQSFTKTGMKSFPSLGNGKWNHIVKDKTGADCVAKFKIDRWFSIAEGDKRRKGSTKQSSASATATVSATQGKTVPEKDEFELAS